MKIAYCSDLHLEFQDLTLSNDKGAEVLVLAGDICTVKHYHSRPEMEKSYHQFFQRVSEQFSHVVYVVGNHEHYNYQYNTTVPDLKRKLAEFKNIHVLDNESFELENKLFIGSTLWTDMNNECSLTMNAAAFGMPDFRIVKYFDGVNYMKFTPQQSVREHNKSRDYIKQVLRNSKDKDVVVVTHHSPSHQSIAPQYKHEELMNGAFHNQLDYMMEMAENVKAWIHGHTHDEFDYTIGITKVLCNPRGYPKENQHNNFKLKYLEV
jgi:predicted phosphodiesterase